MLGGFPVTTAWRVLGLRMEERPPAMGVAANILNKQPRTNDKGWSSSLGVGRGANNPSPYKLNLLRKTKQFKYLGTTVTNQNLIQKEIKRRLDSDNACYRSVWTLLSSRLLSKSVKIRIY
jgi:hypothetical protein